MNDFVPDDQVAVPPFDCGDGFRQLEWRELIQEGDEAYCGTDANREWVKTTCSGERYRPHTANSIYAPYAIHRRAMS